MSYRNYNPVERRCKGVKDRNPKGSQKNPRSLQTNNMHNHGSGDTVGLNKASGQLVSPLFFCCVYAIFSIYNFSSFPLLFAACCYRVQAGEDLCSTSC